MTQTPAAVYPVDLHTHSTRSDGADTPMELLQHAAEAGLKILALTDHDIIPEDPDGLRAAAKKLGIQVIPGIEISCDTNLEDVHLVCLGCDWNHPWFQTMMDDVVQSKIDGYGELLKRLTDAGMPVSWDEIVTPDGKAVPRDQVQKKMIFELLAKKGFTETWQSAKLLVKNRPEFQVRRRKPDPREVIAHVHEAGGIVIQAHPWLVALPEAEHAAYLNGLIEAGLDGIEGSYTYDKTSYGGTMTPEEIEAIVRRDYAPRVSILSGGSDYHADARKGVKNARQLGERGLTLDEFYGNSILTGLLSD